MNLFPSLLGLPNLWYGTGIDHVPRNTSAQVEIPISDLQFPISE